MSIPKWMTPVVAVGFVLVLGFSVNVHASNSVTMTFSDLRSSHGHLAVNLFSAKDPDAFPDKSDRAHKSFYIEINGQASVEIKVADLPAGKYAIAVMHDENSDHKFQTGLFGIPKEGFGFSNNPRIYFGPPSFEKAAFDPSLQTEIKVTMKYF